MSDTSTSPCSSPTLHKCNSLRVCVHKKKQLCKIRSFQILSPLINIRSSPKVQKRGGTDTLVEYLHKALPKIYEHDPLGVKTRTTDFLHSKLPDLKSKIQERLSLHNYLQESLKFKTLSEIQVEIQKEWQKNPLLYSLLTIWGKCMLLHHFTSESQFVQEYNKQRNLIANLTNYYFRHALTIHELKETVFNCLHDDIAHQIINSLKDWKDIYHDKLLPLLTTNKGLLHQPRTCLEFDYSTLEINPQYIDPQDQTNQLKQTTLKIQAFSEEHRIHQRIALLRQIRCSFLTEIQTNHRRIAQRRSFPHLSALEKDDVIGCMIYCIIQGQLHHLQRGLRAMMLLLGNNQLLSNKCVDSYRTDLEIAVHYLAQNQVQPEPMSVQREH